MPRDRLTTLLFAAAGVCIFGGIGWVLNTGDWITGTLLMIIGLFNLVRAVQMERKG